MPSEPEQSNAKTRFLVLSFILVFWIPVAGAIDKGILSELEREERSWVAQNPGSAQSLARELNSLFTKHEESSRGSRAGPRPLDISQMNLPLPLLASLISKEKDWMRFQSLINAITVSKDRRRLDALLALRDADPLARPDRERSRSYGGEYWNTSIVSAADLSWASAEVRAQLSAGAQTAPGSLVYGLINRFAQDLPTEERQRAFSRLVAEAPVGMQDSSDLRQWDLLFRLDDRMTMSRIEMLIGDSRTSDLQMLFFLRDHPFRSETLGARIDKWGKKMTAGDRKFNGTLLHIALMQASPAQFLNASIDYLRLVSKSNNLSGESWLSDLIAIMLHTNAEAVAPVVIDSYRLNDICRTFDNSCSRIVTKIPDSYVGRLEFRLKEWLQPMNEFQRSLVLDHARKQWSQSKIDRLVALLQKLPAVK